MTNELKNGKQIFMADGSIGTIKHIGYNLMLGRKWKHFPQMTKKQINDSTITKMISYNHNNMYNHKSKQQKPLLNLRQRIATQRQVVVVAVQLYHENKNYNSENCPNLDEVFDRVPSNLYFTTLNNLRLANYRNKENMNYIVNENERDTKYIQRTKDQVERNLCIGSIVRIGKDCSNKDYLSKIVGMNDPIGCCEVEFDRFVGGRFTCKYHATSLSNTDEIMCNVDELLLNAPCIDKLPIVGSIVQTRENEWGIVKFCGYICDVNEENHVVDHDYIGIKMRYWSPNCGNGSFDEWKYFNCQMGYSKFVTKDFLIDEYNWNMERVIWIGYYKKQNNKCFFRLLAKSVVRHVLSFVNYLYIIERY